MRDIVSFIERFLKNGRKRSGRATPAPEEAQLRSAEVPKVKLRATFIVEVDARDYLEAAEHQKRFQNQLSSIHNEYPEAQLVLKERKPKGDVPRAPRPVAAKSGRVHLYE